MRLRFGLGHAAERDQLEEAGEDDGGDGDDVAEVEYELQLVAELCLNFDLCSFEE